MSKIAVIPARGGSKRIPLKTLKSSMEHLSSVIQSRLP